MSDQEQNQLWQRLEKKLSFVKGKKAAMDEAVAYAIDTEGDIEALNDHIAHIRREKSYPLRILQHEVYTWEPDYENTEFLAGIQAGFDICKQIYSAPDWESKSYPISSGAPSKIVYLLRMALLEVDGRLDGLEICFENKENPKEIQSRIKDLRSYINRGYHDRLTITKLQAIEEGLAILIGKEENETR